MVNIKGSTVVVTGGQRGLGKAIVDEFLQRGAAKVYATARAPKPIADPRVVSVELDVTRPESVAALATTASDADIVINNAGILGAPQLLTSDIEEVKAVLDQSWTWRIDPQGERPILMSGIPIGADGTCQRDGDSRAVRFSLGNSDWWTDDRARPIIHS